MIAEKAMLSILGIDAAWTIQNPSGIALVEQTTSGWRLVAVESSYEAFLNERAEKVATNRISRRSRPSVETLLASCVRRLGRAVDIVAIDMPLAKDKILGRRTSDNHVAKHYGSRHCSTHSPSSLRPGPLSDAIASDFARNEYPLLTQSISFPGLIEVYPHPALLELAGASARLPYKYEKRSKYWKYLSPSDRLARLLNEWSQIVDLLDVEIAGVAEHLAKLERPSTGVTFKGYEDSLDAIVCAWVAVCAIEKRAIPFGDENSAIWIPLPRAAWPATMKRSSTQ